MYSVTNLIKWMCFTFIVMEAFNGIASEQQNLRTRDKTKNNRKSCTNSFDFVCKNGECISEEKECDGIVDCSDGSDETYYCGSIKCPQFLFRCKYGACIDTDKVCDGKPDCKDKSDEVSSKCKNITSLNTCKVNQFKCYSGKCIDEEFKCDGTAECDDASDEILPTCWDMKCPGFACRCRYGGCVDGDAKCDGNIDCYDGSDEDHCGEKSRRCQLPKHPDHGNWTVIAQRNFIPKMRVNGGTILKVSCQKGYSLIGSSTTVCKNGTWSPHIGTCSNFSTPIVRVGGNCILPNYPKNGQWSVYKSKLSTVYLPEMEVGDGNILTVKCNKGYVLDGISPINCMNGNWSFPIGICLRTCPSIINTSHLTVTCTYNGVKKPNCINPVEGTLAKFNCAPFYEDPSLIRHPVHVCHGGKWSYPIHKCVPVCGKKSTNAQTLIVNGLKVHKSDFPWQVAIYTIENKELICGGSLMSQRVILTAAHCLTNEKGKLQDKENYVVAVGKYYRKYNDSRDQNYAQFSKVQEIILSEDYQGPDQNYGSDIAIIITKVAFTLSVMVQPVCMSLGNETSSHGHVAGWGYTSDTGHSSEELKELKVPLISKTQCFPLLPEDFRIYLTSDKLCAGYLNQSKNVCRGDSGGGLVVESYDKRHVIIGIVSVAPQSQIVDGCDTNQYALYTNISKHITFINNNMAWSEVP